MKSVFLIGIILTACGIQTVHTYPAIPGPQGPQGLPGINAQNCTVSKTGDVATISCPDGTSTTITDGSDGSNGAQGVAGTNGTNGSNGTDGANGADGTNGTNGSNGLSAAFGETPANAATCPNGGTVITMGLDANGDGILEASEVTQSAILCNGINGNNGEAGLNGTNGSNGGTVTFNLVQAIEPCGAASSPWKEVLLGLQGGQILSDFSETSSGQNTRLSFIPNGSYIDTDESGCDFTVSGDGVTNSQISWGAGSNAYSTWPAGGFDWTMATGWVAQ